MKKIKSKISLILIVLIIVIISIIGICRLNYDGPRKVGSKLNLDTIYNDDTTIFGKMGRGFLFVFGNILPDIDLDLDLDYDYDDRYYFNDSSNSGSWYNRGGTIESLAGTSSGSSSSPKLDNIASGNKSESGTNEFSKTNVQVENVDEADIIKTDGNYIYSLSDNKIIITNVMDKENPVVIAEIESENYTAFAPEEILLYKDKLISIGKSGSSGKTIVEIYDITNKENPVCRKNFEINLRYYTSRIADGKLYVISTGYLKKSNDKLNTYIEDSVVRKINYNDIYYFKNHITSAETIVSTLDLEDKKCRVNVKAYLLALENIYVSENNMYLVSESSYDGLTLWEAFKILIGPKGIFGLLVDSDEYNSDDITQIYKFNLNNGKIKYVGKAETNGNTIDQFSLDEYESNLRVALKTIEGSKIEIFNDNMKKIGETDCVAPDEKMYSSRFVGNRGYFITYLNMDPLFTFDLSNPKDPEILGKLKISGYSTYLHPYDENHLIGIGFESKIITRRNSYGEVTSTSAVITGMKMALFDITDMEAPIKISETVIGDSHTTSAILKNHKALLFSKEKGIIAIPINIYDDELEITTSNDNIDTIISNYNSNTGDNYNGEGYLVFGINLEDGFTSKGLITHEKNSEYRGSNLIRGLYISDYLYTVSQGTIKVNSLNDLQEINSIRIERED